VLVHFIMEEIRLSKRESIRFQEFIFSKFKNLDILDENANETFTEIVYRNLAETQQSSSDETRKSLIINVDFVEYNRYFVPKYEFYQSLEENHRLSQGFF